MNQEERIKALSSEQTEFKREIGLFGGVSILGGIMIGGGIFYLGSYVLQRTGFSLGLACLCWVIGGLVSMLGGICFAELGAMMPKAGGMNVYLNEAYHPVVGFINGWNGFLIGSPGSLAAGSLALVAMFGLEGIPGKLVASAILIVFAVYNYFGVKGGSMLQNVTMIAKLVPIGLILVCSLFGGKVAPNMSFTPMDGPVPVGKVISMIAFATIATLWAYEGWTNLNTVAEEIKNPKKNLPLSLIIAIGGITVLYTLFNFGIYRVIPQAEVRSLIDGGELYLGTEVAKRLFGSFGGILVTAGMVVSMLGSINGMTLAFPRSPYQMAHEGHFFKSFAKLHPKYKVPHVAMFWQTVISIALIFARNLDQLTSLVTFTSLLLNTLVIAAVIVMRKKAPNAERPYKVWGGIPTVIFTILLNIGLMVNTAIEDPMTCIIGLAVPAVGVVVYFIFDKVNKKAA